MKKVGYFFFSFLPLLASISLQILLTFPAMGLTAMQVFFTNIPSGKTPIDTVMRSLIEIWSSETFTSIISILFAVSGIFIFGFWYTRQFHISLKKSPKSFLNAKILIGIICLVPSLQILSSALTSLVASFFPSWMDIYTKLMETAGFGTNPSFLLILYAVLLGPIEEELTFRGVIFSSAKRALPFWAANIFQAALFGVFHMNMIQGIYAFFIGLFMGYICEKCGSIYFSIFLHILFNTWGTLMPMLQLPSGLDTPFASIVLFLASVFLALLGLVLVTTGAPKQNILFTDVKNSLDSSDM